MDYNEFPSETYRIATSCGHFYATVVYSQNQLDIIKVLFSAGKAGSCVGAQLTTLANVMEALDFNESIKTIAAMTSTRCHLPDNCVSAIAHKLVDVYVKLSERRLE